MRRTVLFLLAVLPACGGEPGPMVRTSAGTVAAPVEFSVETWPGEGIPVMEARRLYLLLHEAPDPASPIVDTLLADVGAQVHFASTRYQTVQPGSITVLRPTTVLGRDFGERSHLTYEEYYSGETGDVNIRVAPPSTIEFLQHRAEGTCFVRMDRRVINADPCPMFDSSTVRIEREPLTRWWIRTRGQFGRNGWIQVSDSTARAVRRSFE